MKFTELLDELRIPYREHGHEHCRPGWIQLDCPLCSPDSQHWRLGFNLYGHYLNCWSCGRLDLYRTLTEITGKSWQELKHSLGEVDKEATGEKRPRTGLVLPKGVTDLQKPHINYLHSRGFRAAKLKTLWDIQAIGITGGKLAWRLFIPIYHEGRMVSWTTRSIGDEHPKRYIAAQPDQESIDHRTLLYGADYARHTAVVVEGPTDVWRVGPGSLCTFGTAYSLAQVDRISSFPRRVICYDRESPAQKQARGLSDLVSVFPGETFTVVLDAKDPGTASAEEIKQLRSRFLETT